MQILLIRKRRQDTTLQQPRISAGIRKCGAKSGFNQPGGVKPVKTAQAGVVVRQMAGQGTQIAIRVKDFAEAGDLAGVDRGAAQAGLLGEKRRNGLLAFLRLPANRCNRPAFRPA